MARLVSLGGGQPGGPGGGVGFVILVAIVLLSVAIYSGAKRRSQRRALEQDQTARAELLKDDPPQ